MRKVLILENSSKFYWGGGQQVSLMVIKILSEIYSELWLADYSTDSRFVELTTEYINKDRQIHLSGKCFRNPFTGRDSKLIELFVSFLFLPFNVVNLLQFCKRNHLDKNTTLIYCTTKKVLQIAYFMSLLGGYKYIYHAHMVVSEDGLQRKMLDKELARAICNICVSKTVEESILMKNTTLVYNSMDDECVREKIQHKKFVVSVVGSLVPIKGFDFFINSYDYLKNQPDVEYRIYGAGALEYYFEQIIAEKKWENVKLMGFRNDILSELQFSDILVVPTIIKEAFPLVVLQGFLLSIPCIVTNIGGQAENIKDGVNGLLVPVGDAKAIAEKIDFLYENPKDYKQISAASGETYKKFTYSVFKENIINCFNRSFEEL